MKKILNFLILMFLMTLSLYAGELKTIDFDYSTLKFITNGVNTENCIVSYDDDTRLLFIEIPDCKMSIDKTKIQNFIENMEASPFAENMNVDSFDNNIAISLRLKTGVAQSVEKNKNSLDINLKNSANRPLIVIDPGHGGKDPGAVRDHVREKDIVISVSKHLRDELKNDFDIIMTRDGDYFITLGNRPKMGNDKNAKLFVSVHANAASRSTAHGIEVFYFSRQSSPYAERVASFENNFGETFGEKTSKIAQISGELAYKKNQEKSIKLAKYVLENVSREVGIRQGKSHGANFAVLRGFDGPSILIELGFITSPIDVPILMDEEKRIIMAKEIARSIRQYFK